MNLRDCAPSLKQRRNRLCSAVDRLSFSKPRPGRNQFITGGEHRHRWAATYLDRAEVRGRDGAEHGRRDDRAGINEAVSGFEVGASRANEAGLSGLSHKLDGGIRK